MKDFFNGIKYEWKKITWPGGKELRKKTSAILIVSVLSAAMISIVDSGTQFLMSIIL